MLATSGPHYFNQTGRFTLTGDSIRFAFSDLKGADVQRGTFRFDPATRHLTVTILGYPSRQQGRVRAGGRPSQPPAARQPNARRKAAKKRRR